MIKRLLTHLLRYLSYNISAIRNIVNIGELERNLKYKNSERGDVYILYTGSSLKNKSLEWLNGKDIIATNFFSLSEKYNTLKIKHYAVIEPWSYDKILLLGFLLEMLMLRRSHNSRPILWLNLSAKTYIENSTYHFDSNTAWRLKQYLVNYVRNKGDFVVENEILNDFSKITNTALGTSTFAIFLAIYLGYTKIYLLGADYTKLPMQIGHLYEEAYGDECDPNLSDAERDAEIISGVRNQKIKEFADLMNVEIINVLDEGYISKTFSSVDYNQLHKFNTNRGQ